MMLRFIFYDATEEDYTTVTGDSRITLDEKREQRWDLTSKEIQPEAKVARFELEGESTKSD